MRTTKNWFLLLVVIAILLVVKCSAMAAAGDPNSAPILDANTPIIPDSNLVKPGDGILAGVATRGTSQDGEGKLLGVIGYQYGISKFYFAGDIEKGKYFEGGVEFESRDIAEENSVYGLSTLFLMFTPEEYEVTGVAGVGYSWSGNDGTAITIGGVNIRPNEDKNICFGLKGVTPIDQDVELRFDITWKF